jgi:hypothetical protein
VTVKPGPQTRPDFEGDPPTQCLGFVYNSPESVIPIGAELWDVERSIPVDPGKTVAGTAAEMIGGFHIRQGGYHLTIDYYEVGGGYVETHDLDVAAARYYDVRPCHEAYVTVSRPGTDQPPAARPASEQGTDQLPAAPASDVPATPEPDASSLQPQANFPLGQG